MGERNCKRNHPPGLVCVNWESLQICWGDRKTQTELSSVPILAFGKVLTGKNQSLFILSSFLELRYILICLPESNSNMLKIHGFLHVLVLSTCGENSKLLRVKKNRTSQTFPYILPKRKRIERFKEKVCEAVTSNTPEKK